MRVFKSKIKKKYIDDLKNQISNGRIINWSPEKNKNAGLKFNDLKYILNYWKTKFDWEKQEEVLNKFNQYKLKINDVDLHFLHIKSSFKNAKPLMLIHGWPGSIFEFLDIIPMLSNPIGKNKNDFLPFDLVVPSLPNVGYSFSLNQKPKDLDQIASIFLKLMNKIGYKKYFIQGGDLGSFIASIMAVKKPKRVLGIHINMLPLPRGLNKKPKNKLEQKFFLDLKNWMHFETGYQAIQGTKPFTVAHALNSSPIALCSYISEKFYSWTDNKGKLFKTINIDRMLANISLYWFTGCIGGSFWPYYIRHRSDWPIDKNKPIEVPTGYSEFPKELFLPPKTLAEQFYKQINFWKKHKTGGHFAALEQPDELVLDINDFVKKNI
jgi:pimeloyl-ACP methyl ester carboxylesterase|tara:strand:+ start:99 stop:1235 length:1137 start_codon:yes stop_codon:yes gene_type:complete